VIRNGTAGVLTRPKLTSAPKRGKRVAFGPFIGIRDSLDPMVSSDPQRPFLIENLLPLELDKPSAFVGRPGFDQAGSQLGAANKRTGQLLCQFTTTAGTEYTVAIVGGQGIYTYDWTLETWTQVVTVANLTTASVTLSETARCYAVTFANKLVISDGVNKPFAWDGASGAGGLTSLTAASVWYGQPTVYYNKIVAIQNADPTTIEWSEENDPTIGYETAPYNNAWQLIQTATGRLYRVEGTNDALYFWRERSIGKVVGAITADFQSDGTKDGVDETVGTLSPGGAVARDGRIFFVSDRARPLSIVPGQKGAVPHWEDIHETLRGVDTAKAQLAEAITVYDPSTQLVLFGLTENAQTDPSVILAFNPVLNVPVAVWRGYTFHQLAVVKNASAVPVLMHLSADGYAYDHGLPLIGSLWSDELNAGTAAIRHTIETCHLAVSTHEEKRFTRVDWLLRGDGNATSINFRYETPYGGSSAVTASLSGSGARYDVAVYDTDLYAYDTIERHKPFGALGIGRWIRVRLQHEVAGELFGVESGSVEYTPAGDAIGAL
jgi:hypothetical protein